MREPIGQRERGRVVRSERACCWPLLLPPSPSPAQHTAPGGGTWTGQARAQDAGGGRGPAPHRRLLVPRGGRVCVCARLLVGSAEAQVLHASGRITCDHDEQAATECVGSSKFDPSASGLRNACNHVMPKVRER